MSKKIKRVHTNIDLFMDQQEIKNDTELALKLDIPQSTLSNRLRGSISMKTLESLAELFNVSVKELLR